MKKSKRNNTSQLKWSGNDIVNKNELKLNEKPKEWVFSGIIINKYCVFNLTREEKLLFENVNKNLFNFTNDYLYHLNLDKTNNDLKEMFGDVKFICMGGTPKRMLQFALYISKVINYKLPTGLLFENITASTDRYTMYKIGPVLSVNVRSAVSFSVLNYLIF